MFTTTASSDSCSIFDCPSIGRRLTAGDSTKWRCCNIEVAPNCPRCASTNTKFCYYNNYSLSQPRYFCKACRRYWTKGGSLRNVPVGGGCRKSRRARSARTGPNLIPAPAPRPDSVPCIDLAAVFAKYVRRSAEGDEPSFSPGPSNGSSGNYSQIEDGTIFDYHRKVVPMDDLIDLGDNDQVRRGAPDQFLARQEMDGADFACQGIGPIGGQQCPIGDDVATGVLWSSDGTLLPDFGPEGMAVPELGLFSGDDQIGVSSNLPTENWGLFDLSAYEIFSNP